MIEEKWSYLDELLDIHHSRPQRDWNYLFSIIENHGLDSNFIFNEVEKIVQPKWSLMDKTVFVISNIMSVSPRNNN